MAVFDPSKYEGEPQESFFAPEGKYELYFSELMLKSKYDDEGNEKKSLDGKVTFVDGPRKGKYFYHTFYIFNADKEKRKKSLEWLGNFFRAIGAGPTDVEDQDSLDGLLNRTFVGEVYVDEYNGKKNNKLRPWGFHKVGGDPLPAVPNSSAGSSAVKSVAQAVGGKSASVAPGVRPHEDDLDDLAPF